MPKTVLLSGNPIEIGRAYGDLVASTLRERVERTRRCATRSTWGPADLAERAERFRVFVERIAPEWLDEAEAMAKAAGVEAADLYLINALPRGFWDTPAGGCTSALVVGSQSATGRTLLHKNRDVRNEIQDFHVRRTLSGAQLFASRDVGNLGFAHFHSDRLLAGGNNTGGYVVPEEYRDCALGDCHLLRLVAERAGSCDEAIAVLEDAIAKEAAGGGDPHRGAIFLFAEPGKGAVVEMTSRHLASREVRDATLIRTNHFLLDEMRPFAGNPPSANSLRRYARAHELLDPLEDKNVADLVRLSRDHADGSDSICSDNTTHPWMTLSACVHVLRPDATDPRAHSRVAMGNPLNTLYVPVPLAIEGLPAECVDGSFHDLSRRLYARDGVNGRLAEIQHEQERALAAEFASVGAQARFGQPGRLRPQLTEFVAHCVERVRAVLENLLR
jgi:hypothetical protein